MKLRHFALERRFVRLDGEAVILQKVDGSELSVPLKELSAADQYETKMAETAAEPVVH